MASVTIAPIHSEFGGLVTGVDLKSELTPETVETLRDAIDTYSFLHFPEQFLQDEHQLAVTRALGEPEPNHVILGQTGRVEYFGTIGNVQDDGTVHGQSHERTIYQTGNNMWHSDSSFREVPTYVSLMSAHEVPDEGGETEFVSCRSAYGRLPDAVRNRIDPGVVIHDYVFSRSKVAKVTDSHAASLPPVRQRMVRVNPGNGARNYFVGSHAKTIEGWDYDEARELIDDLLAQATRPDSVMRHRWQAGDFVIWDNRCLLHRGAGYDADKYRRRMRQSRVTGTGNSLEEAGVTG